jgi:hypothetical protein
MKKPGIGLVGYIGGTAYLLWFFSPLWYPFFFESGNDKYKGIIWFGGIFLSLCYLWLGSALAEGYDRWKKYRNADTEKMELRIRKAVKEDREEIIELAKRNIRIAERNKRIAERDK